MRRTAAIDLGTNSVKVLIADVDGPRIVRAVHEEVIITRLGEAAGASGRISDAAIARTQAALRRFRASVDTHGPERLDVVATRVFRHAANGAEVARRFGRLLDVEVRIIPGEAEAALGFAGATVGVGGTPAVAGNVLVIDVGGGSTEQSFGTDGVLGGSSSLNDGSVSLQERVGEVVWPEGTLDALLSELVPRLRECRDAALASSVQAIAISGTATTVAAVVLGLDAFDGDRIEGSELTTGQIRAVIARVSSVDAAARLRIPGIPAGREDVLPAGAALLLAGLLSANCDVCRVRTTGLRHALVVAGL